MQNYSYKMCSLHLSLQTSNIKHKFKQRRKCLNQFKASWVITTWTDQTYIQILHHLYAYRLLLYHRYVLHRTSRSFFTTKNDHWL